MTAFDEREKAFEAKYRLDEETAFKVTVRRDKLLGLWAADLFGLAGAEADAYARSVVQADLEHPGDDDVVAKVMSDFAARGIGIDEDRVRRKLEKMAVQAREQVIAESARR